MVQDHGRGRSSSKKRYIGLTNRDTHGIITTNPLFWQYGNMVTR